jgi:hypothetical protein
MRRRYSGRASIVKQKILSLEWIEENDDRAQREEIFPVSVRFRCVGVAGRGDCPPATDIDHLVQAILEGKFGEPIEL